VPFRDERCCQPRQNVLHSETDADALTPVGGVENAQRSPGSARGCGKAVGRPAAGARSAVHGLSMAEHAPQAPVGAITVWIAQGGKVSLF